jgi:hypothetical protein
MTHRKINNIREFVWKVIDTDMAIKKDISRGLLNVRAVANYIINNYKIIASIDSVISAIRRYNVGPIKEKGVVSVYSLLRKAEIRTLTRMASLSLKKNEAVTSRLGQILPGINYEKGDVLRILEGAKLFKIIFDKKSLKKMTDAFKKSDIIDSDNDLSMLELVYPKWLEKTPGVFSTVSNELAQNNISIIDALICANEHIIIVDGKDVLKAFQTLHNLCSEE